MEDIKKIFVLVGFDSEDECGWYQGFFRTHEEARNEMIRKAKEECFYLGIAKTDEHIEIEDEDYKKFWEENDIEDVLDGEESFIDISYCKICSSYGRRITYNIYGGDIENLFN